jgi:3-oxoacyl-[acyl-carrier protein] reductase
MTDETARVVLVTGAGRGIGLNIARMFAAQGATVAVCDIDTARGDAAVKDIADRGLNATFFRTDLCAANAASHLIKSVLESFGQIDVIVNNARSGKRLSFLEETEEDWDMAFSVNLKSAFFLAQAAIPTMPHGSSIINICSISSVLVSLESPSYQASKAGLLHLTRYLAVVAGERGVRVNAILPGFIVQDEHRARYDAADNAAYRSITDRMQPLAGGAGDADDVASTALFLAGPQAKFITGQSITVDGGLTIQDQAMLLLSRKTG